MLPTLTSCGQVLVSIKTYAFIMPKARSGRLVIYKLFECSPTSQVGYHAGKPVESVVYCFYEITLSKTMRLPAQ